MKALVDPRPLLHEIAVKLKNVSRAGCNIQD
jgi:hypothetical protein